jgi:hypothetical protein
MQTTRGALVDHICQEVSIAHDRFTREQGRADVFGHKLCSCSHVQKHFGGICQWDVFAMEQDLAHGCAQLGRTWIAMRLDAMALGDQPVGQQFDLGRFASAIDTV